MQKKSHYLSNIDTETSTGICAVCGPVKLYIRRDRNRYMCSVASNTRSMATTERLRLWVDGFKDVPCADCGIDYPPYVMDFDHVRGIKVDNVSQLVGNGASRTVIKEEIDKCDVVCSNCHRERTYRQGNSSREYLQLKRAAEEG